MFEAKGKPVQIMVYNVDADHVYDQVTRRFVTGYILFISNTLEVVFKETEHTVDSSINLELN